MWYMGILCLDDNAIYSNTDAFYGLTVFTHNRATYQLEPLR